MKLKKISIVVMLLTLLVPSYVKAETTFLDNNAISNFGDTNSHIVISELNTGKIIAKRGENEKTSVSKLANYLALFLLTDGLKNNKINLNSTINITESDSILSKYKLSNKISIKDALFLLENVESNALLNSIFKEYNFNLNDAQTLISDMSLTDTTLSSLTVSDDNKSTVKNISYLTGLILKNYPGLTEITKNPKYTFASGESADNSVNFAESDKFRVLGLDYSGKNSVTFAYSGNTKLLITTLNQTDSKDKFFAGLQKTYDYLFTNYSYKLALKAGSYKINNENITFENDIYDLFYEKHSIKDVTYLLMNKRILLFQKYETVSANDGTVYSDFSSNNDSGKFTKVKSNFINDVNFSKKSNLEKTTIIINRTKYFAAGILTVYSLVFMALYIIKPIVRKD
ncbi:hypothetical protein CG018_01465 [Gemella sp. ND 6198]|uniref:hypothetical protein n=1 Tax=Gemella sp. ND 6198 TaxID=2040624 RepID=UPI000E0AB09F|nr:hypothetical protein [Gemella sp. ND 6198]AXI26204.1 hypothetical protein CG018_01465 [Gemella sp. ND 6198]